MGGDPIGLDPVLAISQEQLGDEIDHRRNDVDKQHERHPPSGTIRYYGKWSASLWPPDAPLVLRPLDSALTVSGLVPDPCFPFVLT